MNDNSLQITIRKAFDRCTRLMVRKSREYSSEKDRLENFKEAGNLQGISPEQALFGMLAKHLVSLSQMCNAVPVKRRNFLSGLFRRSRKQAIWEEKLTDAHNYLFLLEALLIERYGWAGPEEGGHTGPPLRGQG